MYTLLELQSKTLGALRKIGDELNVLPAGDRRRRRSWIEAIVGVNPPLLQLLEVFPGPEVEQVQPIIETVESSPGAEVESAPETPLESKFGHIVYPRPAQGAIKQAAKTPPGVDVDPVSEAIESNSSRILYPRAARLIAAAAEAKLIATATENSPGIKGKKAQESIKLGDWVKVTRKPRLASGVRRGEIFQVLRVNADGVLVIENPHENPKYILSARLGYLDPSEVCLVPRSNRLDTPAFVDVVSRNFPDRLQELLQNPPGVESVQEPIKVQATEPITEAAKTSPGVEVDRAQHPIVEMVETFPAASVEQAQEAIAPAAQNLPGSRLKTSTAHQLLELFKSSAHIIEDFPGVKTEATVSESAIAPAAKNSLDAESDLNPDLTGIRLSERFCARYSPQQAEIINFQADADGQLSLLSFEVESTLEAPDPDDFETLEEFREAIARWDAEHPSSFNHCSDHFPSSVHDEPSSVHDEPSSVHDEPISVHDEPSSVHDEPLQVSLDSLCEWAPCPDEWYEPAALLEQSKVSELSLTGKSSITSDFSIPTFDRWGDHPNRSDEPPDTGMFAKRPKPKPPNFPPQASQSQVGHKLNTSRNYPETIPKPFHRVAAGSSNQPARSPPGGDA